VGRKGQLRLPRRGSCGSDRQNRHACHRRCP
jgi:hypothetical protein